MRLSHQAVNYFRSCISKDLPGARIYLYGSRTNDNAKGGDIDLLVLTEKPVNKIILKKIRIGFYKKFGWQKVDLVNFTFDDQSPFRQLISAEALEL